MTIYYAPWRACLPERIVILQRLQFVKPLRSVRWCDLSTLDFGRRGSGGSAVSCGVHEFVLQGDEDIREGEAGHPDFAGEGFEERSAAGKGTDQDDHGVISGVNGISGGRAGGELQEAEWGLREGRGCGTEAAYPD